MIAAEALEAFTGLLRRAAVIDAFSAVAGVPSFSVALLFAPVDASPGDRRRRLTGGPLTSLEFIMIAEEDALAETIHLSLKAQLSDAASVAARLSIAATTSPTVTITPGVSVAARNAGLAPIPGRVSSPPPPRIGHVAWYAAWVASINAVWSELSLTNKALAVVAAVAIVMVVVAIAVGCYRKLCGHRRKRAIIRPKTFHAANQAAYQYALQKRARPADPNLWQGSHLHSSRPPGATLHPAQPAMHCHPVPPQLSNAAAPCKRSEEALPAGEQHPHRPSLIERVRERASSGMCAEWTPTLRIYENLNEDSQPAPRRSPTRAVRVSKYHTSGYL